MALFVLAGKTDCPHYAKAELLADFLQTVLPDFRIHKICMLPNAWEDWLEDICSSNGWKHQCSPMVWRELTERGGKAMLLGGISDFLEHVQGYYGVTSDMSTEMMLSIAAENHQAMQLCLQDEESRKKLHQTFHIWISSALSPICYHLVPLLFTSDTFGDVSAFSLHLLDVDASESSLLALTMELEDMALPQLHAVTAHSDPTQAFRSAHLIVLLDYPGPEKGAKHMSKVVERFSQYGRLIEDNAPKDVRVLVAGDAYANLKCSLLIKNAPSVDPRRFAAMATQLEREAKTQLAMQLSVKSQDITDVILWGNIGGHLHIDLQRAKVYGYKGAIWGPEGFSQDILNTICDNYDRNRFSRQEMAQERLPRFGLVTPEHHFHQDQQASGYFGQPSDHDGARAWLSDSSPQEIFSLGVASPGQFNIPAGLVFCLPVTFQKGEWSACSDISVSDELCKELEVAVREVTAEKSAAEKTRVKKRRKSSIK